MTVLSNYNKFLSSIIMCCIAVWHVSHIPYYARARVCVCVCAAFMISGFCHDVDQICAYLGYYAASNGNPLLTYRDNILVPSSRVKMSHEASLNFLLYYYSCNHSLNTGIFTNHLKISTIKTLYKKGEKYCSNKL
jgi:formate/nitrite transporter FocA (FNT family)